jgi:hypothetical protein
MFPLATESRAILMLIRPPPPVGGIQASLLSAIKRPEREADVSPRITAGVEKAWSFISTLMTWCFAKRAVLPSSLCYVT